MPGGFRCPCRRVFASAGLALLCTVSTAWADYKLGSEDKLRIRVHEWRASLGEVHEWKALTGEFTIGATGAISLPLIGELRAEGLTAEEVGLAISRALQTKVGLRSLPDASVEVAEFRPFYILGQVDKPGSYPFRPGLTVLQSVSVAGGFDRRSEKGLLRLEREVISGRSELNVVNLSIDAHIARRARLQAELENAAQITFPPELMQRAEETAIKTMVNDERLMFAARRDALRTQVAALTSLKQQLAKEIEALTAKLALKDRQLELLRKEVASVTSLVKRGLAIESRQFALERAEADAEGSRLDLDTAMLRARQEISRAEYSILELQNRYRTEAIADLRATQAKLDEQWQQADMKQKLLYESELTAAEVQADIGRTEQLLPTYSIARKVNDTVVETTVTETSPVEPGDIVRVQLPSALLNSRGARVAPRATTLIGQNDVLRRVDAEKSPSN